MGISKWVVQNLIHPFYECVRGAAFQAFRFGMDLGPVESQCALKEGLYQAMATQEVHGQNAAGIGQARAPARTVIKEPVPGRPLQHFSHRGWSQLQAFRQSPGSHRLSGGMIRFQFQPHDRQQ